MITKNHLAENLREGEQMYKSVALVAVILFIAFPALAQENTGGLAGKVVLDDGSPLPGVLVTLTGASVGKLTTTTSAGGNYRFLKLSPGQYELNCQRDGFKTDIKTDIRVNIGAITSLDIIMQIGQIAEEVVVVAAPRMIDTRRSTVTSNITAEEIEQLPVANSINAIVSLAPGVMDGGVSVGGIASGTGGPGPTANIAGMGTVPNQNEWTVDGTQSENANYFRTTMGTSINIYYLEETQVTVAAQDITARKGGVQVNFVSKRAGNRVSGEATLFLMDKMFQFKQTLPKAMADRGWIPQGIVRHWETGVSLGLPLVKDHLWFFGSAVNVDRISRSYYGVTNRPTSNPNYFGKINAQYKSTRAEFVANWTNYEILGSTYSAYTAATRDSFSPTAYYTAQLNQSFGGDLMLSGKFSYMSSPQRYHDSRIPFDDPSALKTGNTYYRPGWGTTWNGDFTPKYYATPNGAQSPNYRTQSRPYAMVDASYYAEHFLGGGHEIKAGADWERSTYYVLTGSPNQTFIYVNYPDNLAPNGKATFFQTGYRNSYRDMHTDRLGFFFQDVVTFKRLTTYFGVRYDTHTFAWNEAGCPAWSSKNADGSEFALGKWEKYLGAYQTPAGQADRKISGWSPRFNFSYDLTGDGKNVVKLAMAHYGGYVGNIELNAARLNPGASLPYFSTPFTDLNKNYWPDPGEYTIYTPDEIKQIQAEKKLVSYNWYAYYFMNNDGPLPPSGSSAMIDPDFKAPAINEVMLSYEHQLSTNVALRANAIYRRNYRGVRTPMLRYWGTKDNPIVESADSWEILRQDPLTGRNVYRLKPSLGAYTGNYLTNFKKSDSEYKGLRFDLNKRMSHRWMLNASVDLSLARFRADKSDTFGAFLDNLDYFNGGPFVPIGSISTLTGGVTNSAIASSDWQFKVNGLYQLPWDMTISGVFTGMQGWPVPEYSAVLSGTYLAKKGGKFGDVRLNELYMLDLGVEKTFRIGDTTRILRVANIYNVLNSSSVIEVNNTQIPQQLTPYAIVRPGLAQLGFRVKW